MFKKQIFLAVLFLLCHLIGTAQEFKFSTGLGLTLVHDKHSYTDQSGKLLKYIDDKVAIILGINPQVQFEIKENRAFNFAMYPSLSFWVNTDGFSPGSNVYINELLGGYALPLVGEYVVGNEDFNWFAGLGYNWSGLYSTESFGTAVDGPQISGGLGFKLLGRESKIRAAYTIGLKNREDRYTNVYKSALDITFYHKFNAPSFRLFPNFR